LPRLSSNLRLAFSLLAAALLSGCGPFQEQQLTPGATSTTSSPTAPSTVAGSAIVGNVHGGQQAVVGAHIYLFAANSGGYGSPSISMLNSSQPGVDNDVTGNYVLTDAQGNFSISGDYTCTSGQQVYLLALGGNPGLPVGETNPALALMSAFGACPEGQTNFTSTVPYVFINEVTTVAAAYAMAGFATDATDVSSSGTPLVQAGIANSFATASNLADITTGALLDATPAGNGAVPVYTINALADILASCINSTGPVSTPCSTLLSNSLSGGTTGTTPNDTATAAINIAHNPAANVATLYALVQPNAPFQPTLAAAPNDLTVGIYFAGGGLNFPWGIAVDASGNVWTANWANDNVSKFSSLGAPCHHPAASRAQISTSQGVSQSIASVTLGLGTMPIPKLARSPLPNFHPRATSFQEIPVLPEEASSPRRQSPSTARTMCGWQIALRPVE